MFNERIKVAVAVEQGYAVENAAGGDEGVDGASGCHAAGAQTPIVSGGFERHTVVDDCHTIKGGEKCQPLSKGAFASRALQHFGDDEIAYSKRLLVGEETQQLFGLQCDFRAEEVNPDAAVDEN